MKLAIYLPLTLTLLTLSITSEKSYSMTDYKIKNICKKEKKLYSCVKNLQEKRSILQKGKFIEIPVIPYKR